MYLGEISQVLYIFEQFFPLKTNKELIVNNYHFILKYFEKSSFVFLGNKMGS